MLFIDSRGVAPHCVFVSDLFNGAAVAAVPTMSRRTTDFDLEGVAALMSRRTTDFAAAAMSHKTTDFDLKVLVALLVDDVLNPSSSCTPSPTPQERKKLQELLKD